MVAHLYNATYSGEELSRVAFPLGGIGTGMLCLEGGGTLSHVSLRHRPEVFNEPQMFSALFVKGAQKFARVLEGPVQSWKIFGNAGTGNGAHGRHYGLPRMHSTTFQAHFPFATVRFEEPSLPLEVTLTGWSPFIPGDNDNSSLPVAALEYHFKNTGAQTVEAVYSFHAANFMSLKTQRDSVLNLPGGFVLDEVGSTEKPWEQGSFAACVDDPGVKVNCAWFRGGWFDAMTLNWKAIASGACLESAPLKTGKASPGGSIFQPFTLQPGQEKTVRLLFSWYVPHSDLNIGKDPEPAGTCTGGACGCNQERKTPGHRPWYASRFTDIHAIARYWRDNYGKLREKTRRFTDCFYDTTLPGEAIEAVAANLTILKSNTVLREPSGRLWAWEGCCDGSGCCHGSCTHVWNYAQALPHLFPELERSLRATEFGECQTDEGHQSFRANLPIRKTPAHFHAAADGQLGGIMKIHREWRISGDTTWLREIWPRVKQSLEYCIKTWDPDEKGVLQEPHHNTYDIEFWGPDGLCGSFYLGALKAAALMGRALGENVARYQALFAQGRHFLEETLFNGEYFEQQICWRSLHAPDPTQVKSTSVDYDSPEALALLKEEGPKYQYGQGCLSDGVLGAWMAEVCQVGEILDAAKVASHLRAVHRHNFKRDLADHANPQRPTFALGDEGGLLLCTWPRGGQLSLPFPYSDEVWTGVEYQVASHLIRSGQVKEGLELVRACRDRYNGRVRNPFNEYECGHWYARAMASYALLEMLTGVRYDAVAKTLTVAPRIEGDFRTFLATAGGYGTVAVKNGKVSIEMKSGAIAVERIVFGK